MIEDSIWDSQEEKYAEWDTNQKLWIHFAYTSAFWRTIATKEIGGSIAIVYSKKPNEQTLLSSDLARESFSSSSSSTFYV